MRKNWTLLLGSILMGGCCTSLPNLPVVDTGTPSLPVVSNQQAQIDERRVVLHDRARDRDVPMTLYMTAGTAPLPVVVFSHGIGEDRDSYRYLGRALASAGFLAVHVTHAGTDRAMLERGYLHLYRATKKKDNWVNRPLDVSFVLDQLKNETRADLDRVAVAGHSAGAFTAFALAGMKAGGGESLRDPRVKAIVAMSMPRLDKIVPRDGYDAIAIPVLNITGTCDSSLIYRTRPRHRRIPFDSTRAPRQYLVTLRGVNHNSFSNREDEHHDAIAALSVGFLRAQLLGDPRSSAFFDTPRRTSIKGEELTIERSDAAKRAVR